MSHKRNPPSFHVVYNESQVISLGKYVSAENNVMRKLSVDEISFVDKILYRNNIPTLLKSQYEDSRISIVQSKNKRKHWIVLQLSGLYNNTYFTGVAICSNLDYESLQDNVSSQLLKEAGREFHSQFPGPLPGEYRRDYEDRRTNFINDFHNANFRVRLDKKLGKLGCEIAMANALKSLKIFNVICPKAENK